MRSQEEIQKARDALIAVIRDEVPLAAAPRVKQILEAQVDALCWVLGDECQSHFGRNLAQLYAALERRGFVLTKMEAGR